jgi:hypothetical protein
LGERVTARTFERQVVELHVRVAVLNRFRAANKTQSSPSLSESLKADERQGSQRCAVGEVGAVAA